MSASLSEEELMKIAVEGYSESLEPKTLKGYVPNVFDYIRRCDSAEEAFQIIDFLVSRKELSENVARVIKRRIMEKGVRFYGPKKQIGYYVEKYR
ncbi:MAG: DUF2095 family protein [Thaumarchaeota archaeon]|jgi:hypothetical protein|nr:DUF2095 family protein [Nitrososphaerota archaeon]